MLAKYLIAVIVNLQVSEIGERSQNAVQVISMENVSVFGTERQETNAHKTLMSFFRLKRIEDRVTDDTLRIQGRGMSEMEFHGLNLRERIAVVQERKAIQKALLFAITNLQGLDRQVDICLSDIILIENCHIS